MGEWYKVKCYLRVEMEIQTCANSPEQAVDNIYNDYDNMSHERFLDEYSHTAEILDFEASSWEMI